MGEVYVDSPEKSMEPLVDRKKPALLLVGNFLSATLGTRGVCEDLAVGFRAAGWSVITTSSCLRRVVRLADFLMTVWRERNRYEVALVDVYSGQAFLWAELVGLALRTLRKPYVLTLHGGNLPVFAKSSAGRVKSLLQSASAVTTPSPYLLDQMSHYRSGLVLLPNSLDLTKYQFRHRAHPTVTLVWLRAFHELYNPSLAVKVIALLANEYPAIKLLMIGPDKEDGSRDRMMRLVQELGVQERVNCSGKVSKSEIAQWLQQGDIFLNTTRVDNTPVSVLEAMACGLCIVNTNVGGIPYLLKHEHDALLVPDDDAVAMAEAVRRLMTEEGLAARLSCNGRRTVEEFEWSKILKKWEVLFERVATQARR